MNRLEMLCSKGAYCTNSNRSKDILYLSKQIKYKLFSSFRRKMRGSSHTHIHIYTGIHIYIMESDFCIILT